MKEFLLEGLLYPFIAILFFLAFGVPFTYAGFQTIQIEGTKENGIVSMDFTRTHFWGIYKTENHVEDVIGADLANDRFRQGGFWRRAAGVFLVTETDVVRLMAGSSDVDDALKWDMVRSINEFVNNPADTYYEETFRIHNIFGWFGLPFLIIGILGLIGWPGSIINRLRN